MARRASLAALLSMVTGACAPATGRVAGTASWPGDGRVQWRRTVPEHLHGPQDRWAATVGPPALAASSTPGGEAALPLVVVTWNVHGAGGDLDALLGDLRAGRLAGLAPTAPCVLLLQEVRRAGPEVPATLDGGAPVPRRLPGRLDAPDILAQAARLGLHAAYVPSMRNGRMAEDRGNAILSTVPLADPFAVELPLEHQRRVAIGAWVRLAGPHGPREVAVVSAHLTTRTGARRLWLAAAGARVRQARALADALPGEAPLVLGGDFNTWLGDTEPALQLLSEGVGPARRVDRRPTFAGRYRLDHVFARLPEGLTLEMRRLDRAYGSDHFPLAGVLVD